MTNEKLGELFGAYADYYWSVPVSYAVQKITERHPEVTERQIKGVLKKTERYPYWCHFSVVVEGVDQPELTAEHLFAVDADSFISFIAARIDVPICDCDEETMLRFQEGLLNFPEADAIRDFGKTELGLDDEWAQQLLDDCSFFQADALCEGTSWVKRSPEGGTCWKDTLSDGRVGQTVS